MTSLKNQFLLDPEIIFLNHGSFGATPRPVLQAYHDWQLRLEAQPVKFMARDLWDHLASARCALADYLHCNPDELAYIPNATYGVNIVARSLQLSPGDEILATDHAYGACLKTWQYHCQKIGAAYRVQPIPLPVGSSEDIHEAIWSGVNRRTKLIFISHITSPTALQIPVASICQRARQAGILTLVDGAHAPGQIPVNLEGLSADFYTANCHKWMLAPKGAGFLYTRQELQSQIEPLVVSWGWQADPAFTTGSRYLDLLQWMGTDDPSAFLAVPAAIQFMQEHNWPAVQERCREIIRYAAGVIPAVTGLPPLHPLNSDFDCQMLALPLPASLDVELLQKQLYDQYRIEVPCYLFRDQPFLRISIQAYNSQADIDMLINALQSIV